MCHVQTVAEQARVAHAFVGGKQALIERHSLRMLVLRYQQYFRLVDHVLVDARRRLLMGTLHEVHRVFKRAFEQLREDESVGDEKIALLEKVSLTLIIRIQWQQYNYVLPSMSLPRKLKMFIRKKQN